MRTMVVSLAVAAVVVLALVVFVARRDRTRRPSDEDPGAVRQAGADQHRHDAQRQAASGLADRHRNPPST
ncbi:hypothetical protein J5U46_20810 [Micromonospora tulbaghiae]|uniref:Uncharacterized protein n=1 Tax=Micromonospora tulbaghiae TaxID=479978 RepID=A0AAW4JLC6_9ACTN|nr:MULTISPECIES: hypothetical protein [Micromonospora]KAB1908933.1 hypothetical protein F8279_05335 [Micromonospora sp. AMSO1212t]MBO4142592.1 hypothetical protein [Micromonospora tulbaghiae]MDX5459563.1 hypothetical protein [Micromonospora tulbaghiae]SCF15679.1 hypothetical protein GA0070562_0721 [Micromonospora tulbaghiae]